MDVFTKEIMYKFDLLINYYSNIDAKKSEIYANLKKEYFEKIGVLEILPKEELERIKSIEEIVMEEMKLICGKND